ncbi:uncharacterized protein LOC144710515 [Wolffia australiana]
MMAQQISEPPPMPSNAAPSGPSWWDVHAQPLNPNSTSTVEDGVTIYPSNFAHISDLSAAMDLCGEQVDHRIWRQLIQGMGNLENNGENLSSQISEPAFNYSKNPNQITSLVAQQAAINGRFNLPDLMTSWSIGSPIGGHASMNQLGLVSPSFCEVPWSSSSNFSDACSFASCSSQAPIDFREQKLSEDRIIGDDMFPSIRRSSSQSSVSSEVKKKRFDDNAESRPKKSKSEGSATSAAKPQVPKVKLAERITALQQIVSPFGKTDTASVLLETINFISYLHEQVQLLSDPYMKSGFPKDHVTREDPERKKNETGADLKSKGLCLVPVSCTPPVYRENNVPDFWTPTYRGCLYR